MLRSRASWSTAADDREPVLRLDLDPDVAAVAGDGGGDAEPHQTQVLDQARPFNKRRPSFVAPRVLECRYCLVTSHTSSPFVMDRVLAFVALHGHRMQSSFEREHAIATNVLNSV